VVGEFGEISGQRQEWRQIISLEKWDGTVAKVTAEISDLMNLAKTERDRHRSEIVAQDTNASGYFGDMLMAGGGGKMATWTVIEVAFAIGELVAIHFKFENKRPRPVQVYPGLLPPIPTPAHASYPSGHATQSWLAARCVTEVYGSLKQPAEALAKLIGKNRERAGLHYASDTQAGIKLADAAFDVMKGGARFNHLLSLAKQEWP
jgi:PAP2 superfamily